MNELLSTPFGQFMAFICLLIVLKFLYAVVETVCETVQAKYGVKQEQDEEASDE